MKYLKKFENNVYYPVSDDEYESLGENVEEINAGEVKKIQNILSLKNNNFTVINNTSSRELYNGSGPMSQRGIDICYRKDSNNLPILYIEKTFDDWFTLDFYSHAQGHINIEFYQRKCYKCDQIDGLLSFLDMLLKGKSVINESININNYYQSISDNEYNSLRLNYSEITIRIK